jgi:methyl-accepting chemotaxis protein
MKNLSISNKLIVGFGIVLALLLLSIVLSVYSIDSVDKDVKMYAEYSMPNADHVRVMQVDLQGLLHQIGKGILVNNAQLAKEPLDTAAGYAQEILDELDEYKKNQVDDTKDDEIENVRSVITGAASVRAEITKLLLDSSSYASSTGALDSVGTTGIDTAQRLYVNEYMPKVEEAVEILNGFAAEANESAQEQSAQASATTNQAWVMLIACAVVSLLLTMFIVVVIRRSIMNPVREIVQVYDEMAKGNMQVDVTYESRDEMGKMAQSIKKTNALLSGYINDISEKLSQMSAGDMRVQVDMDYIGDFAAIKTAMLNTSSALNHTLMTINTAAEQVATGADQVSSGAQALAAGSSEQAASVEELSTSTAKIAEQAVENSSNVRTATEYVHQAVEGVSLSNEHMGQLTEAMREIGVSSSQITSITKVIEDIAFQTNILALNATIEAARAGNAGKGFAVVADEVRNLAAKSAEAAKQTAELIQASVATVSKGSQITEQTAQILQTVEEKAQLASVSIQKIEKASGEQELAIEQVKIGLNQVSAVVQTNAATAEENSATSEEMSAQAATLREEVGRFKLDIGYEKDSFPSISLTKKPAKQAKAGYAQELGKY